MTTAAENPEVHKVAYTDPTVRTSQTFRDTAFRTAVGARGDRTDTLQLLPTDEQITLRVFTDRCGVEWYRAGGVEWYRAARLVASCHTHLLPHSPLAPRCSPAAAVRH